MIYSPSKADDMKFRLQLLREMEDALKNNCPITAKEIGKMTQWLDNRIKTHDYTSEDKWYEISTPTT